MEDGSDKRRIWRDPQEYRTYRGGGDPQDYDSERDGGLRRNDPYRGMGSANDDTRPDFLKDPKGTASGEHKNGNDGSASEIAGEDGGSNKNSDKNREAARDLASAEEGASGAPKSTEDNLSGARENEEDADGFYSGNGKDSKEEHGKTRGAKGFKGFLKKRAPILAIFLTIFGVGGAMFGAQSLLPFAIEELIIEKFNSIGVSTTISSDAWLDNQLNIGIREGKPDAGKVETLFGLSDYQVNQFRINGIDTYNISAGGKSGAVMLYKKHADTITVPVVGSEMLGAATAKQIRDEVTKASGLDFASVKEPIGVSDALDDKDFYVPYTSASKVWRNGTSSWFDKIMGKVTEIKLNITRGRWANFIARSVSRTDASLKKQFEKTAAGVNSTVKDDGLEILDGDNNNQSTDTIGVETRGDDGSTVIEDHAVEGNQTITSSTSTADSIASVLNSKAVRAAQAAASVACGAVKAAVVIYTTVHAYQTMQFLNLISGFLESVDRVKAGVGETSPMMQYAEGMTTPAKTYDGAGDEVEGRGKRTAIASAGMSWLFGSKNAVSSNDPSVSNVNIETIMTRISGAIGDAASFSEALEICGYVAIASAAVDLVVDAILLVGSFGVGNVVKFFVKKLVVAAVVAVVGIVVSVMINNIIKQITKVITKNAATEWFGEDLGNAVVSGASKYLGGNGTSGGQGPGTEQATTAYLIRQQEVIAKEAEYQRATRSPFDVGSRHTFLGSLAYSIIPLAYSGNSIISFLTSAASTTTNAITAMLPTANAIDTQSMMSSRGDCPLLDGAGIVADAFCNPYIITDVSTTNLAATEVYDIVHNNLGGEIASVGHAGVPESNFESDGRIKTDSKLAKYVTYCGQRTSQYNVYDVSIASQLSGEDGTVSKILSYVPIVGNIATITEKAIEEANINWVTGRGCVVGGNSWGDNKYYQRYAENERLLEGMNPDYTSPVTAYLTEYYEANPLDTSFEGTLARFSGQSKEDVELALDLIDYYQYLEEYDPSTRYAFVKTEEPKPVYYESDTRYAAIPKTLALEMLGVTYADLRGRYYTV